jgi:hypothetical protein
VQANNLMDNMQYNLEKTIDNIFTSKQKHSKNTVPMHPESYKLDFTEYARMAIWRLNSLKRVISSESSAIGSSHSNGNESFSEAILHQYSRSQVEREHVAPGGKYRGK